MYGCSVPVVYEESDVIAVKGEVGEETVMEEAVVVERVDDGEEEI